MRGHGWIEGCTIAIEYRLEESRDERLAEIAAEFAWLKVGVIMTVESAWQSLLSPSGRPVATSYGTRCFA
jgi:hypothetical protein